MQFRTALNGDERIREDSDSSYSHSFSPCFGFCTASARNKSLSLARVIKVSGDDARRRDGGPETRSEDAQRRKDSCAFRFGRRPRTACSTTRYSTRSSPPLPIRQNRTMSRENDNRYGRLRDARENNDREVDARGRARYKSTPSRECEHQSIFDPRAFTKPSNHRPNQPT